MHCWKCGTEIQLAASARVLKNDTCPSCDYDLHVCFNCRLYDASAHNQCSETQAEWVRDKEKANYCDYFEPSKTSGPVRHNNSSGDLKSAFDKLFRD
jgi:hypothetical protein